MKYTLTLEHDDCGVESPTEYGGWELISFNPRHIGYKDPHDYISHVNQYGEPIPANIGIRRRLEIGTAFLFSVYEHGLSAYSLRGEGMQCRWDTTDIAGILLWKDSPKDLPKTYRERQEWARSFLDVYEDWANGNVYHFTVEDENGELIDSCGGFIGADHFMSCVKDAIPAGAEMAVTGDAAYLWN